VYVEVLRPARRLERHGKPDALVYRAAGTMKFVVGEVVPGVVFPDAYTHSTYARGETMHTRYNIVLAPDGRAWRVPPLIRGGIRSSRSPPPNNSRSIGSPQTS
jgi:hypothetical protein